MNRITKRVICVGIGLAAFLLLLFLPLKGISAEGHKCLALTAMTLIFWCTQVAQTGYVSILYLVLLVLLKVAPTEEIFSCWSQPTIWLVVGAYLICAAVRQAGIGERIANYLIVRFIHGYKSAVVTIMVLHIILACIIPHPWPRMLLILSLTESLIEAGNVPLRESRWLKFSVCAFSCPVSLIFLTGDTILTNISLGFAGANMVWLRWFVIMGIPMIAMCGLILLAFMLVFRAKFQLRIDKERNTPGIQPQKPLDSEGKKTVVWISVALLVWILDFAHGLPIGWVTLGLAALMSMPGIGVLKADAWKEVPFHILALVTATMALAALGQSTGMNGWLVNTLLPAGRFSSQIGFLAFAVCVTMCAHVFMGSAIPVMCVMTPSMVELGTKLGIPALPIALLCYIVSASHYILPFHHLNLAIVADENSFSASETLRFAPALTGAVLIGVFGLFLPWWRLLGVF